MNLNQKIKYEQQIIHLQKEIQKLQTQNNQYEKYIRQLSGKLQNLNKIIDDKEYKNKEYINHIQTIRKSLE